MGTTESSPEGNRAHGDNLVGCHQREWWLSKAETVLVCSLLCGLNALSGDSGGVREEVQGKKEVETPQASALQADRQAAPGLCLPDTPERDGDSSSVRTRGASALLTGRETAVQVQAQALGVCGCFHIFKNLNVLVRNRNKRCRLFPRSLHRPFLLRLQLSQGRTELARSGLDKWYQLQCWL